MNKKPKSILHSFSQLILKKYYEMSILIIFT